MAAMYEVICDHCDHVIELWDDGNPYYFDEQGVKQYAWHPDPMRDQCLGNDSPQVCLSCAAELMQDNAAPIGACPKCSSHYIVDVMSMDAKPCPWCHVGTFRQKPGWVAIS